MAKYRLLEDLPNGIKKDTIYSLASIDYRTDDKINIFMPEGIICTDSNYIKFGIWEELILQGKKLFVLIEEEKTAEEIMRATITGTWQIHSDNNRPFYIPKDVAGKITYWLIKELNDFGFQIIKKPSESESKEDSSNYISMENLHKLFNNGFVIRSTSCSCGSDYAWLKERDSGGYEMIGCICHTDITQLLGDE